MKPRRLTVREKEQLQRWLDMPPPQNTFSYYNRAYLCPFEGKPSACEEICWPRFPKAYAKKQCPCGHYTEYTVASRARQMLEE